LVNVEIKNVVKWIFFREPFDGFLKFATFCSGFA
jgi:hypothetical protein